MARQILAIGGGGFGRTQNYSNIEDFIIQLTGKSRPRVCFLPTASGDDSGYILKFFTAFGGSRSDARYLPLHGVPRTDLAEFLLNQDVIYVGGGNTANLLAVWRIHGVDQILRMAYRQGVVLAGWSAGMICWFEAGVTDSFGPLAPLHDGLGLLAGSACPHFDGEAHRRPTFHRLVLHGFPSGYAADDNAALHFVDEQLAGCVATTPTAGCYRVERAEGATKEIKLPTRFIT